LTEIVFVTSMTPVENWTTKDENSSDTIPEDAYNHCAAQKKGDENSSSSLYSSDSKLDHCCDQSLTKIVFVSLRGTQLKDTLEDRRAAPGGPPRVGDPSFSLETTLHGSSAKAHIKILELPSPEPSLPDGSAKSGLLPETSFPDRKPVKGGPPRRVTQSFSTDTEFDTSSARVSNKVCSFPPQEASLPGVGSAKSGIFWKIPPDDRTLTTGGPPRNRNPEFFSATTSRGPPANTPIMISDLTAPEPTRPGVESAKTTLQTVLRSNVSLLSTFTPAKKSDDSRSKAIANPIFPSAPGLRAEVLPSFAGSDVGIPPTTGGSYAGVLFLETFIKRQKQVVNSPRLSPPVMLLPDTATPLQAQISASARRTLSSATAMPARLLLQHCSYTPVGVTNAYSRAYQRKPFSEPALRPMVGYFFVSLCLLLIVCLHLLCLLTSCQGRANCLILRRMFPHYLLNLGQLSLLFCM
jgi:hypothetical protein